MCFSFWDCLIEHHALCGFFVCLQVGNLVELVFWILDQTHGQRALCHQIERGTHMYPFESFEIRLSDFMCDCAETDSANGIVRSVTIYTMRKLPMFHGNRDPVLFCVRNSTPNVIAVSCMRLLASQVTGKGANDIAQYIGRVATFDRSDGHGFISLSGVPDVFMHQSAIQLIEQRLPNEGDIVLFDIVRGEKGPQAANVFIVIRNAD